MAERVPAGAPDPTVLTTEAVERALVAERAIREARLEVLRERLTGIDKATSLLNETVNRTPTDIQLAVGHNREYIDTHLQRIATQFAERDIRVEREAAMLRTAINAALDAQKDAVHAQNEASGAAITKSEHAVDNTIRALAEKIDDLRARLGAMEAVRAGAVDRAALQSTARSQIIAALSVAVAVVAAIAAITIGIR